MAFELLKSVPALSLDTASSSNTVNAIPLHLCPIFENNDPQGKFQGYKLGIEVVLTQIPSGSASNSDPSPPPISSNPCLFEFDTGGKGFWAQPKGENFDIDTSTTITTTYTSGITYTAAPLSMNVTFPGALAPLTASNVTIGLVTAYTDGDTTKNFPIYGNFYGDFGASLAPTAPANSSGLLTVLAQLPAPFNTGFIVYLDQYPAETVTTPTVWGYVFVGLTEETRALFQYQFPMKQPETNNSWQPPQGGSAISIYNEALLDATVTLGKPAAGQDKKAPPSQTASNIQTIFDTGTPDTVIYYGKDFPAGFPTPEVNGSFQLSVAPPASTSDPNPSPVALMTYDGIGTIPSYNSAIYSDKKYRATKGDPSAQRFAGSCNTGLSVYFDNMIMYDIQNGNIGFFQLEDLTSS